MKQRLFDYITQHSWYKNLIHTLKNIRFSSKDDLSLYRIIHVFIEKISRDEIIERANAVAFNFTVAIFPGIIFLFTLIPYIHQVIPEVSQENIMEFISNFMTPDMYGTVYLTIEDIVGNTRGGLLTFGALFSLYLATNGMLSLMRAFNACYSTIEKRGFFKMRLVATMLTIMFAVILITATLLVVGGNILLNNVQSVEWINFENYNFALIFILRFIIIFSFFFFGISFVYYFGPSVHYNWRFFSVGSFIATLLCIGAVYVFTFYLENFATYNKLYGSLGVLIALMLFIEILSIIVLVGYEINASIHKAHSMTGDQLPLEYED
ncbi:YihY/virulence factor BrkB family protein [Fulvivirga sedimenti]|uniref:YihY/virulence factor BrkB family protein n=1 Tax=Fulvivirga sedimenti TaxID=2879465 RepID=A0A9X1HQ47_9BACT|nr:YihY/virulence factor BrkB family protein [Fulvivirga sedimenti]MCA6074279.1 YihY/virulence factor BrkB family protein [Fulvivirga sedimenti]